MTKSIALDRAAVACPEVKTGDPVVSLKDCLHGLSTAAAGLMYGIVGQKEETFHQDCLLPSKQLSYLKQIGTSNLKLLGRAALEELNDHIDLTYSLSAAYTQIKWATADEKFENDRLLLWAQCRPDETLRDYAPALFGWDPLHCAPGQPSYVPIPPDA
jgi:hypothetical protein